MKRRMATFGTLAAALALAMVTGCGSAEPPISQSHHTQPDETARFDAMRAQADTKTPFNETNVERPGPANERDRESMAGDTAFHAEVGETSPLDHNPER